MKKRKILPTEYVMAPDTSSFIALARMKIGAPEARFYNAKGKYVDYRQPDPKSCNSYVGYFVAALDNEKHDLVESDELNLKDEVSRLAHPDGTPLTMAELGTADYYMFIYFAEFAGKVNDKIPEWLEAIKANNKVKIKYIFVDIDYQKSWGLTVKQIQKRKPKA